MLTGIDQHTNFSKGILLQGYTSSDTVVSFIPGNGANFPLAADGEYNLVWWNNTDYADPADDPQVEIVRVVSTVGDVFTVLRAQEGTSATNKNVPNKTYKMVLSFTQHVLDEIIAAAGTGTFDSAANEGGGFTVYDAVNSTLTSLLFKTLTAGANVTITDNGTSLSIASSGSGGSGGYNLFQNSGTPVTQQTTIDLSTLLTATDGGGVTNLTIDVANLALDTAFIDDLVANNAFTTLLGDNTNLIDTLTSNATFQTNVTNFVSGVNPLDVTEFDDFVSSFQATVGSNTNTVSGNFTAGPNEISSITTETNHPGIVNITNNGNQITGFNEGLSWANDFSITMVARMVYSTTHPGDEAYGTYALVGGTDSITITVGAAHSGNVVYYNIGAGNVATGVAFPSSNTWFTVQFTSVSGTLTAYLNGSVVYTGTPSFTGTFAEVVGVTTFNGGIVTNSLDYVETNYKVIR